MLVIHPGYPKTGTTYLQRLIRHEEWYVGAEKTDEASTSLSSAAREGARSAYALSEAVCDVADRALGGKSVFMSEEAILSLRPYEIAFKIGLYRGIDQRVVEDGALHDPVHKLTQIAKAVQGVDRAWLLTVRRQRDWCRSYYRYTLSELGQRRAAIYLQALAAAQTVGGPLYAPTIRLIRALDPDASLIVVPMEVITDPTHQAEGTRFFADRFGLHVPLASGSTTVNASATPLPAFYTRFVRGMTHMPLTASLRRVGRAAEGVVRSRIAGRTRNKCAAFEDGIDPLSNAFREDTAVLQDHSPFDLNALGYDE